MEEDLTEIAKIYGYLGIDSSQSKRMENYFISDNGTLNGKWNRKDHGILAILRLWLRSFFVVEANKEIFILQTAIYHY